MLLHDTYIRTLCDCRPLPGISQPVNPTNPRTSVPLPTTPGNSYLPMLLLLLTVHTAANRWGNSATARAPPISPCLGDSRAQFGSSAWVTSACPVNATQARPGGRGSMGHSVHTLFSCDVSRNVGTAFCSTPAWARPRENARRASFLSRSLSRPLPAACLLCTCIIITGSPTTPGLGTRLSRSWLPSSGADPGPGT